MTDSGELRKRLEKLLAMTNVPDDTGWHGLSSVEIESVLNSIMPLILSDREGLEARLTLAEKELSALDAQFKLTAKQLGDCGRENERLRGALEKLHKQAQTYRKSNLLIGPSEYERKPDLMKVWQRTLYHIGKDIFEITRSALTRQETEKKDD
jgi:hypothetical protein